MTTKQERLDDAAGFIDQLIRERNRMLSVVRDQAEQITREKARTDVAQGEALTQLSKTQAAQSEVARISALSWAEKARADALQERIDNGEWQYGYATDHGWVPEPRGENYAWMRRWVSYGPPEWADGSPLLSQPPALADVPTEGELT